MQNTSCSLFYSRSEHYRALKQAEDKAKSKRLNIWKDYVEQEVVDNDDETSADATQIFDSVSYFFIFGLKRKIDLVLYFSRLKAHWKK